MQKDCDQISLLSKYYPEGILPPEVDNEGNIEYKLKLVNPSPERLEHLITQMKWRLSEGNGEAFYEIGIDDNGTIKGLTPEEMTSSYETLQQMASALESSVSISKEFTLDSHLISKLGYKVTEFLVRKQPSKESTQQLSDLRIVLIGGLGAGKSTLLGHITYKCKDDGRGRARIKLLRHTHELKSGRSSSISHEIIGYSSESCLINYATTNVSTWEQICESSSKIVTFLDTCGYEKYLRTTISGLMGYAPDYALLTIAGNAGKIEKMTREHLLIAALLDIPMLVVITKCDMATKEQQKETLKSLFALLGSPWVSKVPVPMRTEKDLATCAGHFARRGPEVPVIMVSNVTGQNIDLLQKFFNYLPKPTKLDYSALLEEPVEFQIGDTYTLPDVGIVVGGVLAQGRINIKDQKEYYLGPNHNGDFIKVKVLSIHRHRVSVQYAHYGQAAALAIQGIDTDLLLTNDWKPDKGMVLLETDHPECYMEFEAYLTVAYHATGVSKDTGGMIHSGSIRQHGKVISVTENIKLNDDSNSDNNNQQNTEELLKQTTSNDDKDNKEQDINKITIQSGNHGICTFRFKYEPCYLRLGAQILFMEGESKCLGRITKLIPRT